MYLYEVIKSKQKSDKQYWAELRIKSMKKNPLKRTPIKKKAYKIKKVAKKLGRNQKIYRVLRKDYLADHPICECGRKDEKGNVCQRPSVEIHHAAGRQGQLLTEVKYFRAVSRVCHNWAEANPSAAKEIGLSVNRLS